VRHTKVAKGKFGALGELELDLTNELLKQGKINNPSDVQYKKVFNFWKVIMILYNWAFSVIRRVCLCMFSLYALPNGPLNCNVKLIRYQF
jgi:hypothetical protein